MIKVLKNSFVVFLVSAGVFLFLNLIVSAKFKIFGHRPEYAYHTGYMNGYKYHPYVAFTTGHFPNYGNPLEIDRKSFVISGGSTAAGVGASSGESMYFRILEKKLQAKGLIKNILNYAVPGYVSNQEQAIYKNYIWGLEKAPGTFLSLTSFNDMYFYLFRPLKAGNHEFSYAFDLVFRKGYPDPDSVFQIILNEFRKTALYAQFYLWLHPGIEIEKNPILLSSIIRDPYQPKPDPTSNEVIIEAARNFLNNVEATGILAKSRGTKYIVVIQPNYYYGGQLSHGKNEWFDAFEKLQKWIDQVGQQKAAYDSFFDLILKGMAPMQKAGIVQVLDMRASLKDAGPVFLDPVHFDDRGSEIFAQKLAALLGD